MSMFKFLLCLLAFLGLPAVVGWLGFSRSYTALVAPSPVHLAPGNFPSPPPLHPGKPTVVVMLGKNTSEVADVLLPYLVFAASGQFDVVTAAEERKVVALTGGLDLLPHHTFAELDRLEPDGPELVVVPNIPDLQANGQALSWLKKHGSRGVQVLSVCTGAEMLAATGLLDGKQATAHWGDLDRLKRAYPAVQWVKGMRYVDSGSFTSTAGVLSGLDGSLHLLARFAGEAVARQVAQKLKYPAPFLNDPAMPQVQPELADGIFLLNGGFRWNRPDLGVALQEGIDELGLAALYDTLGAAHAFTLQSVAPAAGVVTSKHGLHLLPRQTLPSWKVQEDVLAVGPAAQVPLWLQGLQVTALDAQKGTAVFADALQELARRTDRPTAVFAARRLEHRLPATLEGKGWWTVEALQRFVGLGLAGVVLVLLVFGLGWRRRQVASSRPGVAHEA